MSHKGLWTRKFQIVLSRKAASQISGRSIVIEIDLDVPDAMSFKLKEKITIWIVTSFRTKFCDGVAVMLVPMAWVTKGPISKHVRVFIRDD